MADLIDRQVAIDALEEGFKDATEGVDKLSPTYGLIKAVTGIYKCLIGKLPSAQPEPCDDEWCTDCKEYDHENSCCPRWTKVIRQTRRELQDEFVMTAVDGTLWVTVDDVQKVGRVIVDEDKSKFCRQFYMDAKPEQRTDLLKAEIKRMKRSFTTCINSDYYTGYMSALSAVEGYIAQWEGDAE